MREKLLTAGIGLLGLAGLKAWSDSQVLAEQEQRLLDCAAHNAGWFTQGQALRTLDCRPDATESALARLVQKGVATRYTGRRGEPVYVVAPLLQTPPTCCYCQSSRPSPGRCPNCGAH